MVFTKIWKNTSQMENESEYIDLAYSFPPFVEIRLLKFKQKKCFYVFYQFSTKLNHKSQWAKGASLWTFCYIQLKKGKLMVIKTNFQLLQSSEVCRRCLCLLNIDLSCDLEKNLYQNITIPRGRNVLESYKSIILKLAKDNYAW